MKKIFAIIRKDIQLRFTSPIEWLFFLVLPIVFTLVLSGGTGAQNADNRVPLAVVDNAASPESATLISYLESSSAVNASLVSASEGDRLYQDKQISNLLIIPTTFDLAHLQEGNVQLELKQKPNNSYALAVTQGVNAVVSRVSAAIEIAQASTAKAESIKPFASENDRTKYFQEALIQAREKMDSAPTRKETSVATTSDQIQYDPKSNSSAGQLITWVFIPLFVICVTMAYERQRGTLRRMLTTPSTKATFLLGTILGEVIVALGQMTLLIGFGILVMHLNWGSQPLALAIMMVCSALAAAAIGTAMGTFVKTPAQGNGLSIMFGMVMALLGGCWYPLELFPQAVQSAVRVLPTTWAMQGLLDIVLRGGGVIQILPEAGVLLAFATVFFVIGISRFRFE